MEFQIRENLENAALQPFLGKTFEASSRGNLYRLKQVMKRASLGEKITIGFLGGSITQGSLATKQELCYAFRVADWWKNTYKRAEFTFVNGGIGGTTSHFGVARVEQDILSYRPDLVFVEFSVNDDATCFFKETYEGLVRKILLSETHPALVLIHNVRYDTGGNAQTVHGEVGRYYNLPAVSMQSVIFPEVESGKLPRRMITEDDLHPNDLGHELVAEVINGFLSQVDKEKEEKELCYEVPEKPMTKNAYETAVRYNNKNISIISSDFTEDKEEQNGITDIFKNGYYSAVPGASLKCRICGSEIAYSIEKAWLILLLWQSLLLTGMNPAQLC